MLKKKKEKSARLISTSSDKASPQEDLHVQQQSGEIQQEIQVMFAEGYSGPIPPPDILKDYSKVLPGAPDRIIKMAENEADHRHEMDRKEHSERTLGQWFAIILTLAALLVVCYAIKNGETIVASILAGTTIIALAVVFITGKFEKSQEPRIKPTILNKS